MVNTALKSQWWKETRMVTFHSLCLLFVCSFCVASRQMYGVCVNATEYQATAFDGPFSCGDTICLFAAKDVASCKGGHLRQVVVTPQCLQSADIFEVRSEEHTSELQSLMRISYAVFCLKKKKEKEQKYIDD